MKNAFPGVTIHETATVENEVVIGEGSRVWHQAQLRTRAKIGANCIIGKGVFVDFDVVIGPDCKIQNYACIYHGISLGRGVFVGPHAVFTNDMHPRATDPQFGLLTDADWEVGETSVGDGAAIGANSTILPNVRIGEWAMVAAGAVVTCDVQAFSLVVGSPARHVAWLCPCGRKVTSDPCVNCGPLPVDHPLRT
jgi:acetyltransferase-like isoleucine patch superfamily enzyme